MLSLSSCLLPVTSGTRLHRVRMAGITLGLLTLAANHAAATTYHAYIIDTPATFAATHGTGVSSGTYVGYAVDGGGTSNAFSWTGAPAALTATNLNTTGSYSAAYGISNGQNVGFIDVSGAPHAAILTASAATDLNPTGATTSLAYTTNGSTQVGVADSILTAWTGTAANAVPVTEPAAFNAETFEFNTAITAQLAPPAIDSTGAIVATGTSTSYLHAFLWSSPTATPTDLNPGGTFFSTSIVRGVDGGRQVGEAYFDPAHPALGTNEQNHPVLWSGSASSVQVLPLTSDFTGASPNSISGSQIVGTGYTATSEHAILWDNLSTDGPIDLQPAGYYSSQALSIDADGVIIGVVQLAADSTSTQAVIWVPDSIPEPATLGMMGLGVVGLLARKRR